MVGVFSWNVLCVFFTFNFDPDLKLSPMSQKTAINGYHFILGLSIWKQIKQNNYLWGKRYDFSNVSILNCVFERIACIFETLYIRHNLVLIMWQMQKILNINKTRLIICIIIINIIIIVCSYRVHFNCVVQLTFILFIKFYHPQHTCTPRPQIVPMMYIDRLTYPEVHIFKKLVHSI